MIFFRFIKACKKYKFNFVLSTCGGLTLILRPKNTFENINFDNKYYVLHKLLLEAIKEMKKYRKERGY